MRVGVVGMGAAGLRTAMLLKAKGIHVELFEARERLGGRIETVLDGGSCYDSGGEWIDADHQRVLDLLHELGIEPERSDCWPGKVIYGGEESTEDLLWPDALEDELRVEAAAREVCRNLREPPWRNADAGDLDARTLDDFLQEHCASERGLWWTRAKYRSDEGDEPERIGLLGWLCGFLHYLDRGTGDMSAFRIPGGANSMCSGMAETLGKEIRFGHVLMRVARSETGVELEFGTGTFRFDHVVLTLPPPALEWVAFDPPLSSRKRCALEACGMSSAIKIALRFNRAWWLDEGWNGRMFCDGQLQQTWDGSLGGDPVLLAYVCGDAVEYWRAHPDPVLGALDELSLIWPVARDSFVDGRMHDWIGDPFSQGAFSNLAPNYVLEHMEHMATAEGRIHFAGEHTALYTGFIEGALESAERVVGELI